MELKRLREEYRNNVSLLTDLNEELQRNASEDIEKQAKSLMSIVKSQKSYIRSLEKDEEKGSKTTVRGKDNKNMQNISDIEKRAMDSILRKPASRLANDQDFLAYRSEAKKGVNLTEGNGVDNTTGNGGVTIPDTFSKTIIDKLTEDSPVFAKANKLSVSSGDIDILRETATGTAAFVGELESVPQTANKLTKIHMHATRVGAYMQLTQQLINDSVFNITDYAVKFLSKSLAKAIEQAILVGTDDDEGFEAIADKADADHTRVIDENNLEYEDLIDIYSSINPQYLPDAMLVVSRPLFQAISKLADRKGQTGNYLIGKNMVEGTPGYRLFGVVPVYVSDKLNDSDTNLVFGNVSEGYSMIIKRGINITHVVNDSAQALQAGHLIVMDAYMDGAVTNPDCFIVGKKPKATQPQPQPQPKQQDAQKQQGK